MLVKGATGVLQALQPVFPMIFSIMDKTHSSCVVATFINISAIDLGVSSNEVRSDIITSHFGLSFVIHKHFLYEW